MPCCLQGYFWKVSVNVTFTSYKSLWEPGNHWETVHTLLWVSVSWTERRFPTTHGRCHYLSSLCQKTVSVFLTETETPVPPLGLNPHKVPHGQREAFHISLHHLSQGVSESWSSLQNRSHLLVRMQVLFVRTQVQGAGKWLSW